MQKCMSNFFFQLNVEPMKLSNSVIYEYMELYSVMSVFQQNTTEISTSKMEHS